jgi:hypothetical protein
MKCQEHQEVEQIISRVGNAHLAQFGLTFNVLYLRASAYVVSLNEGNQTLLDEGLCFDGIPEEKWRDYVHCRAHELAARYMRRKWPVTVQK